MISFAASASNMENDTVEQARASNMEEDKASSPNNGKYNEMATKIVEELDNEMSSMSFQQNSSECCIYRVPKPLRNLNWKVYAPLLISIGPLHRGTKRLEAMDKEKLKYFKKLTERNGMDKNKRREIVISIKKQEKRLRNCYSEKSILMESSDDFVKMILLDAVFIIQFFLESNGDKNFEPRMTFDIREDLMLLENQIPLFIIQDIYDLVYPRSQDVIPFLELATCYFGKYSFLKKVETSPGVKGETSPGVKGSRHFTDLLRNLMLSKTSPNVEKVTSPDVEKETSSGVKGSRHFTDLLRNLMLSKTSLNVEKVTSPDVEKETSSGVKGSRHFTDLLRNLMLCKTSPDVEKVTGPDVKKSRHFTDLLRNLMLSRAIQRHYSSDLVKLKYSAIMLRKAGVRFQVTRDECLVNIKFDEGVLKIPQLEVDHNFERLVRNIMALEQYCYSSEAYICSYIKFMDHLIDSAEDVGLLVRKGIIVHRLGNDAAVSNMINNLCENIGDNHTCFGDISGRLNKHYDSLFNRAIATLVLGYFPDIWRGTATVAAAILLILTFIQTLSSVKLFG